jgi:hypothetical protein
VRCRTVQSKDLDVALSKAGLELQNLLYIVFLLEHGNATYRYRSI